MRRNSPIIAFVCVAGLYLPSAFANEPSPLQTEVLIEACASRENDRELRLDACEQLIQHSAENPRARFIGYTWRGFTHSEIGATHAAEMDFKNALAIRDNLALPYILRAEHFERIGNFNAAVKDYTAASELMPDAHNVIALRAYAYELNGDLYAAIADWKRLMQLNPDDPGHQYNYAHLLYDMAGNDPTALAESLKAAKGAAEQGQHAVHFQLLAKIQADLQLFDEAARNYAEASGIGRKRWSDAYVTQLVDAGYLEAGTFPDFSDVPRELIKRYLQDGNRLDFDS